MTRDEPTLTDRFAAQPRVVQWGAAAAVFILAFLAWDTYVRPFADGLRAQADAMQRDVSLLNSAGLIDEFRRISPAVLTMGEIELPGPSEEESQKLVQAINEIVQEFGRSRVDKFKLDRRTSARLRKDTLPTYSRGRRLEKVVADLEFEARYTDAIALLRTLESSPHIESLSNLRMTKTGTQERVHVRVAAEAWGFSSDSR